MGGLQSTERSLSVTASKGLSALRAAPDLCCAVNQRLTSVVREIRTLRSVGAGGSAPGDPVDVGTELWRGYSGTARRKGRQQTNQPYDHRATSRLHQALRPLERRKLAGRSRSRKVLSAIGASRPNPGTDARQPGSDLFELDTIPSSRYTPSHTICKSSPDYPGPTRFQDQAARRRSQGDPGEGLCRHHGGGHLPAGRRDQGQLLSPFQKQG